MSIKEEDMSIQDPASFKKPSSSQDPSLFKEALWFNNRALLQVFSLLNTKKHEVRIVGGAVRNHLRAELITDVDLATTWAPDALIKKISDAGLDYIPTGIEHGTITLMVDSQPFEITSLRCDVKTDGRHAVVEFGTDWVLDAQRRDFTINALYVSSDGKLHDPLGTGLQDLRDHRVRFIGEPAMRIKEDYLRILRFFRFSAVNSKAPYDQDGLRACLKLRDGLQSLSAERIGDELIKILSISQPIDVLTCLYQNGFLVDILACVPNIIPTLRLIEIEGFVGELADPVLRLALLSQYHKGDAGRLGARLRLSKGQIKTLGVFGAGPLASSFAGEMKNLHFFKNQHYLLGKERFRLAFLACWAKSQYATNDEDLIVLYHSSEDWLCEKFPVDGQDLIDAGVEPGPILGARLKELEAIWLVENMSLTKEDLLERLKTLDLDV